MTRQEWLDEAARHGALAESSDDDVSRALHEAKRDACLNNASYSVEEQPEVVHVCPCCGRKFSRPTRCGDCDLNTLPRRC